MLRLAHTEIEPDDDTEESVTVAEAARRLGCATSTVRELVAHGRLRGHRVGKGDNPRGVRISRASIEAYKMANAITPREEAGPTYPARNARPTHRQAIARLKARGIL